VEGAAEEVGSWLVAAQPITKLMTIVKQINPTLAISTI
jgi:hypothetical protein